MIYLTADIGSTYTKLVATDIGLGKVIGTSCAFTTIETDVREGFNNALSNMEAKIGKFSYDKLICCSSAAGGLKMVALGLVPELTAKAARLTATSAGAKVVKTYSFEISRAEQEEIYEINPDLVLLCGGTDGGNKDVIISNARRLCQIDRDFSVIVAGNKSASHELQKIFTNPGNLANQNLGNSAQQVPEDSFNQELGGSDNYFPKDFVITQNVMPEFNKLNIEPARKCIEELFISRIVQAKGLSALQEMSGHEIIPTPLAVMRACELLSRGVSDAEGKGVEDSTVNCKEFEDLTVKGKGVEDSTKSEELSGLGDLIAVDLGGATTDIYSMAEGKPTASNVLCKGLPEPYAKRSVEGDLGMRYSLSALAQEAGVDKIAKEANLSKEKVEGWIEKCCANPDIVTTKDSLEQKIEEAIAKVAVEIATDRHAGIIESVYTPMGQMFALTGKDLSEVPVIIGIGGAITNSVDPAKILSGAKYNSARYMYSKPKDPSYMMDSKYVFASMGLLGDIDKVTALKILKEEINKI
ncbi:MAG: glutamate mutase L [Bacteroidales bacterium]